LHLDQSCAYLEIYLAPKGKVVNLKLAYRRIQAHRLHYTHTFQVCKNMSNRVCIIITTLK